jgi:hypothetical protein
MPTSNSTIEGEIHDIHQDVFLSTTTESNIHYDNQSNTSSKKRRSTLDSIHSQNSNGMTCWKMKSMVLLCMLSLPGKKKNQTNNTVTATHY